MELQTRAESCADKYSIQDSPESRDALDAFEALRNEAADVPNDATAAVIEEGRRIAGDSSVQGYRNMRDLRAALRCEEKFTT